MRVHILLFAQMRIEQGASRIALDLTDGATVEDAIATAAAQHPAIARHVAPCMVAVGLDYVESSHILRDGDEVSLVPPVQGG